MLSNPIFGVFLCFALFNIGKFINEKYPSSYTSPQLMGTIIGIIFLSITNLNFDDVNQGAQYISFLLLPSTVVLAIPLYKQFDLLIKNLLPILIGVIVGSIASVILVVVFAKVFGLSQEIMISFLPKTVTGAVGPQISSEVGGIVGLTMFSIMVSGFTGLIFGEKVLSIFGVKDKVAKGVALGTICHVLGTVKGIEMGEVEGAMSGLCIGLSCLVMAIIIPIAVPIAISF